MDRKISMQLAESNNLQHTWCCKLLDSATYGLPLDYPSGLAERYEALSLSDLQEETKIVRPESMLWLVVGDLSKIRDQIEALDIATIETWDANGDTVNEE